MSVDPELVAILDHLEDLEMQLLAWGVVDGGFAEQEIIEIAESVSQIYGEDALEQLEALGLITEAKTATGRVWRTRMAETVRLLAQLRQLFPQRAWRTAPRLVGDYRFEISPRQVPERNIQLDDLIQKLGSDDKWRTELESPVRALLRAPKGRSDRQLSDFQQRGAQSVLRGLANNRSTATVVCAGTGSGKTLAFYLPALAEIATLIDKNAWVKAVALYPRNELLKDQLRTALQECERLAPVTDRKILVGAFFGPTPQRATINLVESAKWDRVGQGYQCPFLTCLDDECNGALIWLTEDLKQRNERLVCERCTQTVESNQIALTRERMRRTPPDLLFGSAEMLNRTLSDTTSNHLFGIGTPQKQRPRLLLLDEIHTYAGVSGAQTALLLRRWRHAVAAPVHIVGLSATLDAPVDFMERLTGLSPGRVDLVEPRESELKAQGKQYNIALRGDPASQTALLSTTIQSAMLMRRMLDTYERPKSKGLYGQKLFVFTDNLDVTNRMFFQLRDAEGMTEWGDPRNDGRDSLATLRSSGSEGDAVQRDLDGQVWGLATALGHPLVPGNFMSITRTSSQDAGVEGLADMVVATAALEVGFDDPTVGAVIQHKSPTDAAQFLQRRGRAGRPIEMRPWTIVVLSDYGRDRLAFQSYDQLFSPRLRKRTLPVSNRYVLRMQATFAFMDWVSSQLRSRGLPDGSVWSDLAGPAHQWQNWRSEKAKARQQAIHNIILEVLESGDRTGELARFLERALDVEADEVTALLWEPPRSLMLEVLPTLARRLGSDWHKTTGSSPGAGADLQSRGNPMPDFVPPNLFTDLSLPELNVEFPADANRSNESIGSLQGLREFAPGRITHRYAVRYGGQRQWVAPLDYPETEDAAIDLREHYEWDELGHFAYRDQGGVKRVRCVRPWSVRPQSPPKEIEDRSNAFPVWHWEIVPQDAGFAASVPARSSWSHLVSGLDFFLHNLRSQVEVRRFTTGSTAEIARRRQTAEPANFTFDLDSEPVALGVVMDVDGLRVAVSLPDNLDWFGLESDPVRLRSLRTERFAHLLHSDPRLAALTNRFQRDWIAQLLLSSVATRAMASGSTVAAAVDDLTRVDLAAELEEVLEVIFQSLEREDQTEDHIAQDGRLSQTLSAILRHPDVQAIVVRHARSLAAEPETDWLPWLQERLKATLGAALLQGIQLLCPDFDIDDLALDLHPGGPSDPSESAELWITETTIGGAGLLEDFFQRYSENPSRFFRLVESALAPSDNELVDRELSQMLSWLKDSEELRSLVKNVRTSHSHENRVRAWQLLQSDLRHRGLFLCHPVMVGINSRLLRPGATVEIDLALHDLITHWNSEEERLGIELGLRVLAYSASGSEQFEKVLNQSIPESRSTDRQWRFSVLSGLLWPRGGALRSTALQVRSSFAELLPTERTLVTHAISDANFEVRIADDDWFQSLTQGLQDSARAWLVGQPADAAALQNAIQRALGTPVHFGYLELFPQISAVRRSPGEIRVLLEIDEVDQ